MRLWAIVGFVLLSFFLLGVSAQQCGSQAWGRGCPNSQCCSKLGWCGITDVYCGQDCQRNCPPVENDVGDVISESMFDEMLLQHADGHDCPGKKFITYDAFVNVASKFPSFGNSGDMDTRKREIAAFLAQTSHETTGEWDSVDFEDAKYMGYCSLSDGDHDHSTHCNRWLQYQYPCVPGRKYYGRGPFKITGYIISEYGQLGEVLDTDLLGSPDMLDTDPVVSFESAIWFWMKPRKRMPSPHSIMTNDWEPSFWDLRERRFPGYGMTTNVIKGGVECGWGPNPSGELRISMYKLYCEIMGVDPGKNRDCYHQVPFGYGGHLTETM